MVDYDRHTSQKLLDLFAGQDFPHQGQHPSLAKVVILGIDANYSPEISRSEQFFENVIEYHRDGVQFWERHGVHHPFLLRDYPLKKNTGGVGYHRKFAWMQLGPQHAKDISFIELLPVPTTGQTEKARFWELFDPKHATRIDDLVETRAPRLVLLSQSLVTNYMSEAKKRFGVFKWLPNDFNLGEMTRVGDTIIYGAPHFSSTTYKKEKFVELGTHVRHYCEQSADASLAR